MRTETPPANRMKQWKKSWQISLILALATPIYTFALTPEQQLQQGVEAVEKGDYQTALKLWQPLAEQGYAKAQVNLGVMYAYKSK